MLNNVVLQGRLVRTPDMRYSSNGDAVVNVTLAVERNYKNKQGERDVDFMRCAAWRKTGELIAEYFDKGDMIIVEGELRQSKWQDKDGNNRSSLEVNVNNIQFVPNNTKQDKPNRNYDEEVNEDFDVPF